VLTVASPRSSKCNIPFFPPHLPTARVNVSMYVTDDSVIETPVKKLYDSVLQLSGPRKRAIETGQGSSTKSV